MPAGIPLPAGFLPTLEGLPFSNLNTIPSVSLTLTFIGVSMSLYRKYGSGTVRQCVTLSPSTVEGLHKIQEAFATRWPKEKYPTLSAVLDQLLEKNLAEFEKNPEWLDAEVRDFERRYKK